MSAPPAAGLDPRWKNEYGPPTDRSLSCKDGVDVVVDFLRENEVQTIYYKGGTLERDFCFLTGYKCTNLEDYGVPKAPKELNHDPSLEVDFYHQRMKELAVLEGS